MSEAKAPVCGGLVYLDDKQSKEAAEIVLRAMRDVRHDMDVASSAGLYIQNMRGAEIIAELAKSLQTVKPIFWSSKETEPAPVVHARRLTPAESGNVFGPCSRCGAWYDIAQGTNDGELCFCPCCGAKFVAEVGK